jgi:hypothetical protein
MCATHELVFAISVNPGISHSVEETARAQGSGMPLPAII